MKTKKPKIYISTYDDINNPHYGGGGAIAVHELARQLSKKYEMHVISWNYNGKKKEIIDGVFYERFGLPTLSPKVAMFVYQICLPFVSMKRDYDIWFESFCPPFTTSILPLFTKKSVIGIVHMLAAEDMERKYKLPFHLIQNIGIKKYKNLIVTSEVLKMKIKKIHPESSITVISNGITSVFKPKMKKENYILFLGRIEIDQKGIDLLIAAFKEFVIANNGYKLMIVGDGDPKEILRVHELVGNANLTNNVIFKKRVKGNIKNKLLQNASCVVIPSRFETYSLVALEAMANGAPLICFDLEGLSWVPLKAIKKVKKFDVNALSKAISEVVSNKKHSNIMIQEGNNYAKQFTWEKIVKQYESYIDKLTS